MSKFNPKKLKGSKRVGAVESVEIDGEKVYFKRQSVGRVQKIMVALTTESEMSAWPAMAWCDKDGVMQVDGQTDDERRAEIQTWTGDDAMQFIMQFAAEMATAHGMGNTKTDDDFLENETSS